MYSYVKCLLRQIFCLKGTFLCEDLISPFHCHGNTHDVLGTTYCAFQVVLYCKFHNNSRGLIITILQIKKMLSNLPKVQNWT